MKNENKNIELIEDTWIQRAIENGVETDGVVFLWEPTKANNIKMGNTDEKILLTFYLVFYLIFLVLFIYNFNIIAAWFLACLKWLK